MNGNTPHDRTPDGNAVPIGRLARTGDRGAIVELARAGGRAKARRDRERKAQAAEQVVLATIGQMRQFIEELAAELKAATLDAARKASAGAALIKTLVDIDGLAELARENQRLGAELAAMRAMGPGDRTIRLQWSTSVEGEPSADVRPTGLAHAEGESTNPTGETAKANGSSTRTPGIEGTR